jgi:hypothetical protein
MSNELDALGCLQAVYRGQMIAGQQRMKAAIEALPFERPKLGVSVNYNVGMGSRLETGDRNQWRLACDRLTEACRSWAWRYQLGSACPGPRA